MLNELQSLKDAVAGGTWRPQPIPRLWGGAGVIVATGREKTWYESQQQWIPVDYEDLRRGGKIVVVTPHARAVSAMIYELKQLFQDHLDYVAKDVFYPRLGMAAFKASDSQDRKRILAAMLEEAIQMAYELEGQPYFAYGSNIDLEQMADRCPGARLGETSRLKGYQFLINERGVATLVESAKHSVEGLLWWILPEDEAALDRYEGVARGFYRKDCSVTLDWSWGRVKPLIYFADNTTPGKPRDEYLERILAWGEIHGFAPQYLEELKSWR